VGLGEEHAMRNVTLTRSRLVNNVPPTASTAEAMRKMQSSGADWLLVVEDGIVLGGVDKKSLLSDDSDRVCVGQYLAEHRDQADGSIMWLGR